MSKLNPKFVIGVTILVGWILSVVVVCNKIENTFQRLCNYKGWYWTDDKTHKRIYP